MAYLLDDAFTDTTGTPLENHTPTGLGGPWTKHAVYNQGFKIVNGLIRPVNGSQLAVAYSGTAPASADYAVRAVVRIVTAASNQFIGPSARIDPAAKTRYTFATNTISGGVSLGKDVAGTETALGTPFAVTFTAGLLLDLRLEVVGTNLFGYLNGVLRCTATDASITAAGRPGVYAYNSSALDGVGHQIDGMEAWDAVAAAGGTESPTGAIELCDFALGDTFTGQSGNANRSLLGVG